ncbi:PREDICTED: uncharacterized protein LOC104770051 isoform X2 [Camelina sativa]|uniref:Uncharacterized protein LOC104770051 isoform X2 n=1 Tax=Camelina sativa TaxID=90675 RepID=A0ABM1RGC7_CAMSA|nr:PREDICTED: uncharacterized protein LOC104770051 isoform X2 [Camelina sativa]
MGWRCPKKAPISGLSRPLSPSCSGGSTRDVDLAVKSSESVRRSTRLRLQPLRKPNISQRKKHVKLCSKMPKKPPTAFFYFSFCLRSPSDYSLSSYFSNGLCSSEDGSSQFASPPLDGLMTKCNLGGDDLGLCESFDLLNVGEEGDKTLLHHVRTDQTHHQYNNQRSDFGNYEASGGDEL